MLGSGNPKDLDALSNLTLRRGDDKIECCALAPDFSFTNAFSSCSIISLINYKKSSTAWVAVAG